jgi:LDH2 family malate/lactate/ureidoglycolate dehydrogenase
MFMSGPLGKDILPMYGSALSERRSISHFFVVLRIEDFTDLGAFGERMALLARRVRRLSNGRRQRRHDPGDPEKHAFARRSVGGIPVDSTKYEEFLAVSPDFARALIE